MTIQPRILHPLKNLPSLIARADWMATPNYASWTRDDLVNRIRQLENKGSIPQKSEFAWREQDGKFDFSLHSTRKIALKFCYSGWEYNGLAYQTTPTPLPTVEGVLYDALVKARLIDEKQGFEGCGWEKCGRTDRGVSAAGQVISLNVRTALAQKTTPPSPDVEPETVENEEDIADLFGGGTNNSTSSERAPTVEHDYVGILNRLLPETIRMLAWSPVAPTFSARHNCTHRHYKYFFSDLHLNVPLMREAASYLVGLHDFRNLCKIDAGKQITVFLRRILSADISPVEGDPGMYVLDLVGTAFLYHQVRNIMAILLLVGRGLEHPDIIKQLLNVSENAEPGVVEVLARKPEFQMADGLPLVLWECGFSDEDVSWSLFPDRIDRGYAYDRVPAQLQEIHERSRVHATLNRHFMQKALDMGHPSAGVRWRPDSTPHGVKWNHPEGIDILFGAGTSRRLNQYVPLMLRKRNDTVDAINARWRDGKGARRAQRDLVADDGGDE